MRSTATPTIHGAAFVKRVMLTSLLCAGMAIVALPALATAADPSGSPDATAPPTATPAPDPTPAPTPDPTMEATPGPTASPTPERTSETASQPTPSPEATATPTQSPVPTAAPTPVPAPSAPAASLPPRSMNVFVASGFRYQDPNWAACTAASVRTMLNLVAYKSVGGEGFRWRPTNSGTVRDAILAWERKHDTMAGGNGSDPHGWRNALNFYGWGPAAMLAGSRVYDDFSYSSYSSAMKATVRALLATRKPVGILARRGAHAQMITGYYGLVGNPFAKDATGAYTNAFTVGGFYLSDPLRSANAVNRPISYSSLARTLTLKWRFQRYYETDSRYDDPYTPGYRVSKTEWYARFVVILPIR
jgi:hypothetical protein